MTFMTIGQIQEKYGRVVPLEAEDTAATDHDRERAAEINAILSAPSPEPAPADAPDAGPYATLQAAARALARREGWVGHRSGWIYDPSKKGCPTLAQGYLGLGVRMQRRGRITGSPKDGYFLTVA